MGHYCNAEWAGETGLPVHDFSNARGKLRRSGKIAPSIERESVSAFWPHGGAASGERGRSRIAQARRRDTSTAFFGSAAREAQRLRDAPRPEVRNARAAAVCRRPSARRKKILRGPFNRLQQCAMMALPDSFSGGEQGDRKWQIRKMR